MKRIHLISLLLGWILVLMLIAVYFFLPSTSKKFSSSLVFKEYSLVELGSYNGTDSAKPILLAYKGKVYDVSGGKKYYDVSGRYHYLAGRDSTRELDLVGGKIIEVKYPVVGKLATDAK